VGVGVWLSVCAIKCMWASVPVCGQDLVGVSVIVYVEWVA